MKVKIRMLRTIGVKLGQKPVLTEGSVHDVAADLAKDYIARGLAEAVEEKAAPKKEPEKK